MSDHSFARSAAKLLLDNMTARDTKDYTVVRRSSFVEVNYDLSPARHGDAVDASLVLMLWEDISAQKLVECVSSRCWTKKLLNDETSR